MKSFMFELPTLKMFLICSYFLPILANFIVLKIFLLWQLQHTVFI